MNWDAANISPTTRVQVAFAEFPTSNFVYKIFDSGTSGEITGLKPNTKYIVRVSKICGTETVSTVLGLGTVRTLSTAEELAICDPNLATDLCKALEGIETGQRGATYIDIKFPTIAANVLGPNPHRVKVQYRPLNTQNAPAGAWQEVIALWSEVQNKTMKINGLVANTMYEIKIVWEALNNANTVERTCNVLLSNTPTMGDDQIGPVFTQNLPDLTLDCSTPRPVELVFPNMTGGCSVPRITFTDQNITTTGCDQQLIRTWIAVDDCGRSSSQTQVINFKDTQAPTFVDLPANNAIIQCTENLPEETPTAIDNCSEVTLTATESTQQLNGCNAIVTRTWIATDACGNTASYIQTIKLVETLEETNGEDEEVPPLPVNCGVAYTPPPITNTTPLNTAQAGQTLDVGGFPMLLKDVTGSNGTFSGRAKLRLPFGEKVVYVDFNGIKVNSDKKITFGTLTALPDPNFVMPDPGNLNIGGEICLPDPPVLSAGFNSSGEYILQPPYENWQPGDPVDPNYDPNGFDANGYHIGTGTKVNEAGCNQQGLDANGNICNNNTQGPYYWLHNNGNSSQPTTPEGIAYAATLQTATPNIRALVEAQIDILLTENAAALTTQKASCATIRTDLNTKVGTLDRKFFFGANDVFFAEDMNLQFSSKPIALQQNVPDRSPQIVGIEEKHIELYYCDKLVYKFKQTALILTTFKSATGLDILVPDVLAGLQRLTAEQVASFTADPNKLKDWIKTFVGDELFKELQSRGIVHHDTQAKPDYLNPVQSIDNEINTGTPYRHGTWIADASDDTENMRTIVAQSFDMRPEVLQFEYLQGFEYVGGVHRAFYLDAIAKARDVNRSLTAEGEDPESLLPIRVEKEVGGRIYTMLLDKISITPTGGKLDAYFILEIPNTNQKIVFKATNVPFTPGGLSGDTTVTRLSLQSTVGIRLNNAAKLNIIGNNNRTYVAWDCEGFAGMGIEADVEFCRKYLTPLKADLSVDPDEEKRVKARFIATMPAWGEFIAKLTMDKFALTKHPDYKWEVQKATLDFSDVTNAPGFADITANYYSEFKTGNTFSPQWKGFFMEKLKVTLPKTLTKSSATPVSISVEKLIIDDRGLTGIISLNAPIIPLSTGNLDGFAYSMDQISVAVVANRIQGGGFGGLINVPVFKGSSNTSTAVTEADCFRYAAKIIITDKGDLYEFVVTPGANAMKMDILVGTATLKPSSSVKVTYKDDVFTVIAKLSGEVTVNGNLGENTNFKLPKLSFEDVTISNQAPYFLGGHFGIPIELGAEIGGFGLTINSPKLIGNSNSPTCNFNVGAAIKLVGDGAGDQTSGLDFGAATSVIISGEMETDNGRQRWKYKDYSVSKIAVNASFKGVDAIKGEIEWYKNDPTFGKGFRGKVSISISGLKKVASGGLGIDALAQFGKKDDYKYFFVDILAKFDPGIDLGGLAIRGLGGGVYYHMVRDTSAFTNLANAPNGFNLPSTLGVSLSGIKYTPDKDLLLGIKATIIVATTKEEIFNGMATFEISFGTSGVKDIALYGSARMMVKLKDGNMSTNNSQPSEASPVAASFGITYVFATRTLHGELAVFADIKDAFTGAGPYNSVGKAVLHFAPDQWYINVGTPSEPLGIRLKIPVGSGPDLFILKSYFCVGTGIPAMPPLPAYVQQMTGAGNFMANESQRASGRGFALGASVEISTGHLQFLIFVGRLDMGLGFDLMMQKYDGIVCPNNDNKPLGINGWYASGQIWGYVNAEIGIQWKNKTYSIMELGAAATLQGKLPNPFWAKGSVGGEYKILNGLIKGNCNFKFTIGKSCQNDDENSADLLKLIEDVDPYDHTDFVEVHKKPVAYFGVPVNGSYSVNADDEEGTEIIYNVKLNQARLTNLTTGALVSGQLVYTADKRQMTYKTPSLLPGNTPFKFEVSVESRRGTILVKEETKIIEFTTGEEPTVIPRSNIASAYPIDGMYNLYKNETTNGYIELKDGQPALLGTPSLLELRFSTKTGGVVAKVPVEVTNGSKMVKFTIPATLSPNQMYRMDLGLLEGDNLAARSALRDPASATQEPEFRSIYTAYFRTSIFNKFVDKIAQFNASAVPSGQNSQMQLTATIEPFDRFELLGTGDVLPLTPIVEGNSDFVKTIRDNFEALRKIEFYKPYGNSNLPTYYLSTAINGVDTLYRVTGELYNANAQGVTSAVFAIKNNMFKMARTNFMDWANKKRTKIIYECANNNSPNPVTLLCYTDLEGHTFVPPSSGHCCESVTLLNMLYGGPSAFVLRDLYEALGNIKPINNSTHPFTIAYRLPNGQITSSGTILNFKYSN
jgi:hypothetical protein